MSAISVEVPFPVFYDRAGEPLENGYVFIGQANLNPQTNPIQVFFDRNLTQLAAQPLRTLSGYISNAGTPAQVFVDAVNFSIQVQDKNGTMVYNFPDGTGISSDACGITYDPPFTGGVPYPVCEKLAQTVSINDFDGDLQAAIAAAVAGNFVVEVFTDTTIRIPTDAATMQDALERITGNNNITITVLIESGHSLTKPLWLIGGDYSNFIIQSQDAQVTVVNGALDTAPPVEQVVRAVFVAIQGCNYPVIDVLLNLTNYRSGSNTRNGSGMLCVQGSNMLINPNKGCIAGFQGVIAYEGSVVNCYETIFTNAIDAGITAWSNSSVYADSADASDSELYGVRSTEGASLLFRFGKATDCARHASRAVASAFLDVTSADLKNCATKGVYARHSCVVMANFADCSGAGEHGFFSQRGSIITAIESIADDSVVGYEAIAGSTLEASVSSAQNCTTGFICSTASTLSIGSTNFAGCTNVGTVTISSTANLRLITCDSPTTGVLVSQNSSANLAFATITNSADSAIRAFSNSQINAESGTFTGAAGNAVYAQNASIINASSANASNSDRGFIAENGSTINASSATASSCTREGVFGLNGGTINFSNGVATGCERGIRAAASTVRATSANVSGATTSGVLAETGSDISLRLANCRKGGINDPTDISCLGGSTIRLSSTTGGTSIAVNTPSASGLILG